MATPVGEPHYFIRRSYRDLAEHGWTDEWTFSSFGTVTLDLHWDALFDVDPICPVGICVLTYPPGMDCATLPRRDLAYHAAVGIYDLDNLLPYYEEDSEIEYLFPTLITAIFIEQIGSSSDGGPPGPLDIYASLSFAPIPGHRYLVGSEVLASGRFGGDIDALNTVFLERSVLAPGQALSSVAVANPGAQNEIVTNAPEPSSAWLILLALGGGPGMRRLGRSPQG